MPMTADVMALKSLVTVFVLSAQGCVVVVTTKYQALFPIRPVTVRAVSDLLDVFVVKGIYGPPANAEYQT